MDWISSKGYQTGKVMNALRVTLVGAAMGPQIFSITDFIGREETLKRARKAISVLPLN
jgi:glutamyl-tRNA synthetase